MNYVHLRFYSMALCSISVKMPYNFPGLDASYPHQLIQHSRSAQMGLNPLLAKSSFHTLWNYAQVDLIDLLIAINSGHR